MMTRDFSSKRFLLLIVLFGLSMAPGAAMTASAATLVVDDDGQATAADCTAFTAAFNAVQPAVNAASPGDTILICPGTYATQVVVSKSDLTIRGAGAGLTVLRPAAVTPNSTNSFGNPVAPVILVDRVSDIVIANLTIDGSAADSGAMFVPPCPVLPFYVGIFFRQGSGTVTNSHVTGIKSGSACSFGIRAEGAEVVVTRSLFDEYGVSAIACLGQNAKCTIVGNTIRGQGPVNDQIQVGIQLRAQAAGTIAGNVITDHFFTGGRGVPQSAVGIFLVFAQPSSNARLIRDNVFADNQVNVQRIASAAAF